MSLEKALPAETHWNEFVSARMLTNTKILCGNIWKKKKAMGLMIVLWLQIDSYIHDNEDGAIRDTCLPVSFICRAMMPQYHTWEELSCPAQKLSLADPMKAHVDLKYRQADGSSCFKVTDDLVFS